MTQEQQELIEVLDLYFVPLFQFIGSAIAFLVLFSAVYFVLKPFFRSRA